MRSLAAKTTLTAVEPVIFDPTPAAVPLPSSSHLTPIFQAAVEDGNGTILDGSPAPYLPDA